MIDMVNARIIHGGSIRAVAVTSDDIGRVRGKIVVVPNLSPEPVLRVIIDGAAGVIARVGAVTAHGAAVLREAGVPAAVAVDFPDDWIGREIILRADKGYVGLVNHGQQ